MAILPPYRHLLCSIVFGPFLDVAARQRFRSLYVLEGLPTFDERDTTTLLISPIKNLLR
jgi:hypothetical protein